MSPYVLGAVALSAAAALTSLREAPTRPAPLRAAAQPTYAWPVEGPVLRPFEAPAGPFGPGHRGIDIGAAVGTPVRAAQAGTVAFAGTIAGERFVSLDHPDGVRTTYSFLAGVAVAKGDEVARRQVIGSSGLGHEGSGSAHLHLGARIAGAYIDPMILLEPRTVSGLVHLAPL